MTLMNTVKWISPVVIFMALSACATDYVSQLSEPNFGANHLKLTEGSVDPTMLMNGTYASKQLYGSAVGTVCMTDRCTQQAPLWSSGWRP
jgi:hypothetical protein